MNCGNQRSSKEASRSGVTLGSPSSRPWVGSAWVRSGRLSCTNTLIELLVLGRVPPTLKSVGRVLGKGFAYFTSVGVADVADRLHDLALHVTGSWSVILSSKVHRVELRSWVFGNGCDQAEDLGHLD
ncbi:hypothetical protein B296_00001272 [Ensete ventricosum]|uniref:Uncharacterized protein n=1 Tax=Ensete ventricosum TaxID=4639 RepID=A0A427AQ46_ENSVE|nr:hypothetical protein B296_00001272 [Ensete ventricosum]